MVTLKSFFIAMVTAHHSSSVQSSSIVAKVILDSGVCHLVGERERNEGERERNEGDRGSWKERR